MKKSISLFVVFFLLFNTFAFADSRRVEESINETSKSRDQMLREARERAQELRHKIQIFRNEIKLAEPDSYTGARLVNTASLYGMGIAAAGFVVSIFALRGQNGKGITGPLIFGGIGASAGGLGFLGSLAAYSISETVMASLTPAEMKIAEGNLELAERQLDEIESQIEALDR